MEARRAPRRRWVAAGARALPESGFDPAAADGSLDAPTRPFSCAAAAAATLTRSAAAAAKLRSP